MPLAFPKPSSSLFRKARRSSKRATRVWQVHPDGDLQGQPSRQHFSINETEECIGEDDVGDNIFPRYHIWSEDHPETFHVSRRWGGGTGRPGSSSRVYVYARISQIAEIHRSFSVTLIHYDWCRLVASPPQEGSFYGAMNVSS